MSICQQSVCKYPSIQYAQWSADYKAIFIFFEYSFKAISAAATDDLVLKHQAISIHSAD